MKCPQCGSSGVNDMGYCYECEEITCSIHDDWVEEQYRKADLERKENIINKKEK